MRGADEPGGGGIAAASERQRAHGRLRLEIAPMGGLSRIRHLAEAGSARLRLPRTEAAEPEAVVINTAGGIASGDLFETDIRVAAGARLCATTASAERVYRSEGETSRVATRLRIGEGSRIDWLPQETILYDRARLDRSLEAEIEAGGTALLYEAMVFGRAARGETVRDGVFRDRWRIRRADRLVYADTLRVRGDIASDLARPAIGGGARALATCLYVGPDAEARLEHAREALAGSASEYGASAWDGMLAVRWLAPDIAALRADAARFMVRFRDRPMPRVWMC